MIPEQPSHPRRPILLGLPHPVTRALAAYLQTMASACDPPVDWELVTHERDILPGEIGLYLRPDVTETGAFVVSLADGAIQDRVALAERMDARWPAVSRLPIERVLANPNHAVDILASCFEMPASAGLYAAAQRGIAGLRDAVAAFDHPLAFWRTSDIPGGIGFVPNGLDDVASAPELSAGGVPPKADAAQAVARAASGDPDLAATIFVLSEAGWRTLPASMS